MPTTGQLAAGELALNTADSALYFKNSAGAVAAIADTIDGGEVSPSAGILLNFNGSNNGTTFTHSGTSSPTITRIGSVVTSTTQVKYGSASGYFPGANNCLDIASDPTFNLGGNDFCVEMWIYPTVLDGNTTLLRIGQSNATSAMLFGHSTGLGCYVSSNGSSWNIINNQSLSGVTTNAWHHVALSRSGSTWRGFVNGAVVFTVTSSSSVYSVLTNARLGAANSGGAFAFTGYIDDFKVTNGAAVYTSAFTPAGAEAKATSGPRASSVRMRGATAATLASVNPTPAAREPVYEVDTRCLKVGTGTDSFNALGYVRPYVTATDRILGRSSAGAGAVEEITCTSAARSILSASNCFAARAWVSFNGSGTVAIRASGNVTSITDNGGTGGDYTVNFTTAMSDANYAAVVTIGGTSNAFLVRTYDDATARTASALRITCVSIAAGWPQIDPPQVSVVVFR